MVTRLRRNPLYRALRLDKLISQSLETTLRWLLLEEYDRIPALAMIRQTASRIRERAERLVASVAGLRAELIDGESLAGGGSTPDQALATCLIAIDAAVPAADCERQLRANDPPVIARVENERVLIDLRTVFEEEESLLAEALRRVPGMCLPTCSP